MPACVGELHSAIRVERQVINATVRLFKGLFNGGTVASTTAIDAITRLRKTHTRLQTLLAPDEIDQSWSEAVTQLELIAKFLVTCPFALNRSDLELEEACLLLAILESMTITPEEEDQFLALHQPCAV